MNPTPPQPTAADTVVPTAQIFLFPVRAPVPAAVLTPQQRLARALKTLDAALQEQRVAVAAWRGALAELKTATNSLGESLQQCRANVAALGEGVAGLHQQAKVLGHWAGTAAPAQN